MMSLFGDKESFAIGVDPLARPPDEADKAAAATWARIQLWVDGRNLFEHSRRDLQTVEEGVMWPFIHLARWIVRSWESLFYDETWPIPTTRRNARDVVDLLNLRLVEAVEEELGDEREERLIELRDHFVETHALRSAAAGGAFPSIYFSRQEGFVSVSWRDSDHDRFRFFVSRGESEVPTPVFLEAIARAIDWVLEQLSAGPERDAVKEDVELLEQWKESISGERAARTALLYQTGLNDRWPAIRDGLDEECCLTKFLDLPEDWAQRGPLIESTVSPVAMAFRCVAPVFSETELLDLRKYLMEIEPNSSAMESLREIAGKLSSPFGSRRDYDQGYDLAIRLRSLIGNERDFLDVEALLEEIGVPVEEYAFSDPEIDGAAVCDDRHGPIIVVNPNSKKASSPWGRRMVLAHELCHLLVDRQVAASLAVISGPWAPVRLERRANAFAIELLLPKKGIQSRLPDLIHFPSDAEVEQLMTEFGVGRTATTYHVGNRFDW